MSNFPPGVTGSERQIVGNLQVEEQIECNECGHDGIEVVSYWKHERNWTCSSCGAENTEFDEDQWQD